MRNASTKNPQRKSAKQLFQDIYRSKTAYLYLVPLFFFLILFSYYPAFSGIYHSFFDWSDTGEESFIGFSNYLVFLGDTEVFWPSVGNMVILLLPRLLIQIVVPLIVAELIFNLRNKKAKNIYRLLIMIPMVAPGVVTTLLWGYIYDPNYGLVSAVWKLFGGQPIDWLHDSKTVIGAIIFMGFPWVSPTNTLIYLAGLNAISSEARESARMDGANTFQVVFYIDIPDIFGQVRFFLINGIIALVQDYSIQFLLTEGGPGYDTMVPGYYMYQAAFQSGRMGFACAIGTFLFLVILGLTLLSFRLSRGKEKR
ncbi:MAG: sugar ABC transporter permease [Bacilli bacterium]|nr:sugar ABC transporter permease [Bacilli bacterium]